MQLCSLWCEPWSTNLFCCYSWVWSDKVIVDIPEQMWLATLHSVPDKNKFPVCDVVGKVTVGTPFDHWISRQLTETPETTVAENGSHTIVILIDIQIEKGIVSAKKWSRTEDMMPHVVCYKLHRKYFPIDAWKRTITINIGQFGIHFYWNQPKYFSRKSL